MPDGHAKSIEVLVRQLAKNFDVDVVLGKTLCVLGHSELFEPLCNLLHRGPHGLMGFWTLAEQNLSFNSVRYCVPGASKYVSGNGSITNLRCGPHGGASRCGGSENSSQRAASHLIRLIGNRWPRHSRCRIDLSWYSSSVKRCPARRRRLRSAVSGIGMLQARCRLIPTHTSNGTFDPTSQSWPTGVGVFARGARIQLLLLFE